MAAVSIIAEDGTTFSFDAAGEATLTRTVVVTEHPTETGVKISDHAQRQPDLFAFSGVVTETPFDNVATTGGIDRLTQALAFFESIATHPVTIVSEVHGTLENFTITRFPSTRGSRRDLRMSLEFKEIIIAESSTVELPAFEPEDDVGEQPTTVPDEPAQTEGDASLLLSITRAFGVEP